MNEQRYFTFLCGLIYAIFLLAGLNEQLEREPRI
jgi:hypothetical protein